MKNTMGGDLFLLAASRAYRVLAASRAYRVLAASRARRPPTALSQLPLLCHRHEFHAEFGSFAF